MASLTPGVLLKLLQHASDRNVKVTGEHRSALLQVIEIVPALAAGDDPWHSRGFFLKVSDSLHSSYVSICDEDVDLIFSNKIQLGQFLHVSRLDSAYPVPVLRGIKPVPKKRPCIGNPTDLVSSDCLLVRPNVDILKAGQGSENMKNAAKKDGLKTTQVRRSPEPGAHTKSRRTTLGNNANVEDLDLGRLSLDSMRKGWDNSLGSKNANGVRSPSSFKPKATSGFSDTASVLSDKRTSSGSNSAQKHQCLNYSPPSNKSGLSTKIPKGPKDSKPKEGNSSCHLVKVPVSSQKVSDQSISWESLPSSIHALGKDAFRYRNAAFVAAVDALQEASATECVIRCMSMFSELCGSVLQDSPGHLVEQFLDLHQSMVQASTVVNALLATRNPEGKTSSSNEQSELPEACKNLTGKAANATSWVQAALDTDISKFSLFVKQDRKETLQNGKYYYVVLEKSASTKDVNHNSPSPKNKHGPKIQGSLCDLNTKKVPSPKRRVIVPAPKRTTAEKEKWLQGSGLKDAASLVRRLLLFSRGWFLKYLEDSLSNGFGLKREEGDDITGFLGQLKRINQWLEDAVSDNIEVNERIESLRKELYGFLLEHVDASVLPSRRSMN
ncbi:hypothetical protein NE237_010249 [Protea cynaroides]|uniref:Uncharacterized protein n=1 Tax=Protea cynaroides TaxID=273540 RepID=A0A9Q0R1E3_9MAGN|nr:hypothetical protein NE237_010249 [Protea cynaroides]